MAGDFSRTTFEPTRHYAGVLMQQGRVQLDADWNEQRAIDTHRTSRQTVDTIGHCGAPKLGDGFRIEASPRGFDLLIGPGRFYAGGLLCESEAAPAPIGSFPAANQARLSSLLLNGSSLAAGEWVEIAAANKPEPLLARVSSVATDSPTVTFDVPISAYQNAGPATLRRVSSYTTQPYYPNPDGIASSPVTSGPAGDGITLVDGEYLVYLEAWNREVDALEDPHIREVALGGPDTAERLQTVWQVKFQPLNEAGSPPASPLGSPLSSPLDCCRDFPALDDLAKPPTGTLRARTDPPGNETPCLLPPSAGYQRLENQLYRVEIFQGGDTRAGASIVWSRENGSIAISVAKVDGNDVYLADLGKDDVLGLAFDDWVEITSREMELNREPRFLARITAPPDKAKAKVTISRSTAAFAGRSGLRLRRWDMKGAGVTNAGIPLNGNWIELEGGVKVQFGEGSYRTSDYWQVPARTATGQIEWPLDVNRTPAMLPPLGTRHYFCRLALLSVRAGAWTVADCRETFPSLTDLSASDVAYEGEACDLKDCATVQDALDLLCRSNDLRFHNKHLHGRGIVCGLQVVCGPNKQGQPRHTLTVKKGYAIDCDGADIVLKADRELDAASMLLSGTNAQQVADGEYCLIIDPKTSGLFRFVPFQPPKNPFQGVLEGTLLKDFIEDCIQPLIEALRDEFTPKPGEQNLPVTPAQKHISTFSNLLIQFANPDNGSFVFLSGDRSTPNPEHEDAILRDFYQRLRAILQSSTFCAMFDNARPFPDYPYTDTGIATIFGKGLKTRFRAEPSGARGYAFGVDDKIHIYDLARGRMAAETAFPTGGAIVQDLAFSADGRQVFAAASLNATDTMFAVADVQGLTHTWRTPVIIRSAILSTLATHAGEEGVVYAASVGKGLLQFKVSDPSGTARLLYPFNAFGHLTIDDNNSLAVATAGAAGATSSFTQVLRLPIPAGNPLTFDLAPFNLSGTALDDIAVFSGSAANNSGQIYVTAVPPAGDTELVVLPLFGELGSSVGPQRLDLGERSGARLAFNPATRFLMIAMAESYRVLLFQPGGKALENFRQPVQVGPQAIAFSARAKSVYVLNTTSNTVTAIPIEQFDPRRQLDLAGLVKYRSGVIDAYFDLLGGLFQYLKDCLCDHFLVNCPTCEEDEKDIFLGCVTFSGGQIKKICNFEKRQQVHTFPKLKYWLSLVPVIPLVGKAIEALCCLALPNFFAKQKAPQPSNFVLNNPTSGNFTTRVSANTLANTLSFVKGMGIRETFASSIMKAAGAGSILKDFTARRNKVFAPPQPAFQAADVVGLSLDEAKTRLAAANVTVDAVTSYDPARPRENIGAFLRSPRDLAPGSGVVLVEDQGAVRFVAPSDPASGALRDGIAQGLKQLAANTASVRKVAEAHSDLEASLDTTRKALADAQSRLDETAAAAGEAATSTRDIRGEMAAVQRSLVEAQQQVAQVSTAATQAVTLGRQLQTQVEAANRALAQSQPALTAAATLQDQVTALKTELARVQKASEDALSHRDQQISGLQERLKAVDDLSSQVAALTKATPPKRAPTKSTKPRE